MLHRIISKLTLLAGPNISFSRIKASPIGNREAGERERGDDVDADGLSEINNQNRT